VNKQEFSASSWRSNQGYTKMHGQPTIKTLQKLNHIRNKTTLFWVMMSHRLIKIYHAEY